ncbi:MAG: AAA family ATPase [Planctomycetes bacterium]|nr:AAA family ATPase [Planctomycetota bacterium]
MLVSIDGAAIDAAVSVLGEDADVAFTLPAWQTLYRTLVTMRAERTPVDIVTLRDDLERHGLLEKIGGVDGLVDLSERVPHPGHVEHYAKIVRDQWRRREVDAACWRAQEALKNPAVDVGEVIASLREAMQPVEAGVHDGTIQPAFIDAVDLMGEYQHMRPPVVEGLLRLGETLNVIAAAKLRKSWLVLGLLLCLAAGRSWLGFQTRRCRVLLIDNELHQETLARRIPKVMEALAIKPAEIAGRFSIESLRGRLVDIYQMSGYFKAIPAGQFDVIALDAWYRFQPRDSDENSNAAICAAYSALDRYAKQTGAAFVVVHHSSKGWQGEKRVVDVGAGAGAQARAADAHLILREHAETDCVVLEAAVRSWPPVPPAVLRWTFPVWTPAPDLKPADLRKPRAGNRGKQAEPEAPAVVIAPPWSPERFAGEFVPAAPTPRAKIIALAVAAGVKERRAEKLLGEAESLGLAYKVAVPKDKRAFYQNVPEPALDTHTHTARPPTPPRRGAEAPAGVGVGACDACSGASI